MQAWTAATGCVARPVEFACTSFEAVLITACRHAALRLTRPTLPHLPPRPAADFLRLFCISFTKKRPGQVKKTAYAQSSQVRGWGRACRVGHVTMGPRRRHSCSIVRLGASASNVSSHLCVSQVSLLTVSLPLLPLPPPHNIQIRTIRKKMVEIMTREATSCDLKELVRRAEAGGGRGE